MISNRERQSAREMEGLHVPLPGQGSVVEQHGSPRVRGIAGEAGFLLHSMFKWNPLCLRSTVASDVTAEHSVILSCYLAGQHNHLQSLQCHSSAGGQTSSTPGFFGTMGLGVANTESVCAGKILERCALLLGGMLLDKMTSPQLFQVEICVLQQAVGQGDGKFEHSSPWQIRR